MSQIPPELVRGSMFAVLLKWALGGLGAPHALLEVMVAVVVVLGGGHGRLGRRVSLSLSRHTPTET